MTTDFRVARRLPLRRRVLAPAVLSTLPLLGACVSALDDTTAFGFAGAASSEGILVAEQQSEADHGAPEEELIVDAAQDTPDISEAPAIPIPAEPAPRSTSGARDLGDKAIAAYASGGVTGSDQGGSLDGRETDRSLFSSLFARAKARPPIGNADKGKSRRVVLERPGTPSTNGDSALPGVDPSSLFEIGQRASADSDIIDEINGSYQVASLTGLARVAPNGLRVQRESVKTDCFPAKLVGTLRAIERRFGKKVVVTSGYRSPKYNRRVNGARRSQHMGCKAADIIVPEVDRFAVAAFVRALPGRGGVGTYCHTAAIHVDVGPKRDWNWRCRRK